MAELLEKIPVEKRWALTSTALSKLVSLRVARTRLALGAEEGIIAPVLGTEKMKEISMKIWAETGKKFWPYFKEIFNLIVEDAVGAAKLSIVAGILSEGADNEYDIVEANTERAILRISKCVWWKRAKENEVNPELMHCEFAHQLCSEEGLKAINPKFTYKITKVMPRGDPYCEVVIEFKDD